MSFSSGALAGYSIVANARERRRDDDLAEQVRQAAEESGVQQPTKSAPQGALGRIGAALGFGGEQSAAQPGGQAEIASTGGAAKEPGQQGASQTGGPQDAVQQMLQTGGGGPMRPGESVSLADQGADLAAKVRNAGGVEAGQPITRPNWNQYFERMQAIAASTDPARGQRIMETLASTERVRAATAGRMFGAAATYAQAGNLSGAAAALNAANGFMPDGYVNQFEATADGLVLTRSREGGQGGDSGGAERINIPRDQIANFAMGFIDPERQRRYMLDVDKFREEQRANREREGQGRAQIGIASGRLELDRGRDQRDVQEQGRQRDASAAQERLDAATEALRQQDTPENRQAVADATTALRTARGALTLPSYTGYRNAQQAGDEHANTQRERDDSRRTAAAQAAFREAERQYQLNPSDANFDAVEQARRALYGSEGAMALPGQAQSRNITVQGNQDQRAANQDQRAGNQDQRATEEARRAQEAHEAAQTARRASEAAASARVALEQAQAANTGPGANAATQAAVTQAEQTLAQAESASLQVMQQSRAVPQAQQRLDQGDERLRITREHNEATARVRELRAELARETNAAKRVETQRRLEIAEQNAATNRLRLIASRNPGMTDATIQGIGKEAEEVIASIPNIRPEHQDTLRDWIVDFRAANRAGLTVPSIVRALHPYVSGQRTMTGAEIESGIVQLPSGQQLVLPEGFRENARREAQRQAEQRRQQQEQRPQGAAGARPASEGAAVDFARGIARGAGLTGRPDETDPDTGRPVGPAITLPGPRNSDTNRGQASPLEMRRAVREAERTGTGR